MKAVARVRVSAVIVATIVACGLGTVPALASQAPAIETSTRVGNTVSTGTLSPGEESIVGLAKDTFVTTRLGYAEAVSAREIEVDPELSDVQKLELLKAAATGTVKSNHYSQFTMGASYTVTQNGTFYCNGSRVWVTSSYLGKKGSHSYSVNYAVYPVTIKNIQCPESGPTTQRDTYMQWEVSVPFLTYGINTTANLEANSTITGSGATAG